MILYSLPMTEAMTYALMQVPSDKRSPDVLGYTETIDDFARINGVRVLSTCPAKARDTPDGIIVRRTLDFYLASPLPTAADMQDPGLLVILYEDRSGKVIGVSDRYSCGLVEHGEMMVRWEVEEGETAGLLLYANDPEIEFEMFEVKAHPHPLDKFLATMVEEEDKAWMTKIEEWSPVYLLTAQDRVFLHSVGIEP